MLDRDVGGGRIGASRASDQTKDYWVVGPLLLPGPRLLGTVGAVRK
jgi:hypothetical protein